MCLRTAWRLVWLCVADGRSRVWAAEARPHGTSMRDSEFLFYFFSDTDRKTTGVTLLLKASVLRATHGGNNGGREVQESDSPVQLDLAAAHPR